MSFAVEVDGKRRQERAVISPGLASAVARSRALKVDGNHAISSQDIRHMNRAARSLRAAFDAGAPRRATMRDRRLANHVPTPRHGGMAVQATMSQIFSGIATAGVASTLGPVAGAAALLVANDVGGLRPIMRRGEKAGARRGAGHGRADVLAGRGGRHTLNKSDSQDQIRIARALRDVSQKQSVVAGMMRRPVMDTTNPDVVSFSKWADMSAKDRRAAFRHGGRVPLGVLIGGPSARYVAGSHEPRPAQQAALMGVPAPAFP